MTAAGVRVRGPTQHGEPTRRRSARRGATHDVGQATVELALAVPLVALFLLAGAQLTIVVRDQLAVIHAAREAARAAAVSSVAADGIAAGTSSVRESGLRISINATNEVITATVERTVATDVPIIGAFLPDVTVRARAVMRVEP